MESFSGTTWQAYRDYVSGRLVPALKEMLQVVLGNDNIPRDWTNNNAESLNHVLKQICEWKSKPIHKLVEALILVIKSQYKDVERALIGRGPFRLAKGFGHFEIEANLYMSKNEKQRKTYWNKFMRSDARDPVNNAQLRSTDGKLVVPRTPSGGKKPCQKRSRRAERTRTQEKVRKS